MAAVNGGHLKSVTFLVENGANIEHRGHEGATVLIDAVEGSHAAIVEYLLSKVPAYLHATRMDIQR